MRLTVATGRYDRTAALHDGRVVPEGLDVTWLKLNPEQLFWRMIQHREFDASEMALASFVILRDRGDDDFVGIPAFLSRSFRHDAIFVSNRSSITRPEDLAGKRVGVPEYQMTTAVWLRATLEEDYGVAPEEMTWLQGSLEQPGRIIHTPVSPPGVTILPVPADKTLAGKLAAGEIDALISPRMPSTFWPGSPDVRRLFDEPWAIAKDYYQRTKLFPIMHMAVVRKGIVDTNPWVPQTLYNAFLEAKRLADVDLHDPIALRSGLPFLVQQAEEVDRTMGKDLWSYGVDANRRDLEEYIRISLRQGLITKPIEVDDMFPASVRRVSRI